MAVLNPEQATFLQKIDRFGGLRFPARLSADSASELCNFRILSDGTLEKRCGYYTPHSFSSAIRGLWEGSIEETGYLFLVVGNTVYRKKAGDTTLSSIYFLPTSTGKVTFVFYNGLLYLLDGYTLLVYRPALSTFDLAEGYAPLYGRNWHPTEMGEVLERPNLIRSSIRIHYLNSNASDLFQLPFAAKRIERVLVDGVNVTAYTFSPSSSTFTIPSSAVGVGSVEVLFVPEIYENRRTQTVKAKNASVYRDSCNETLMCFDGESGYQVYCSRPVSAEMLDSCNRICPRCDPLYLPDDGFFTVGSQQQPIRALCQHGKQMLVFNEDNVWGIRHGEDPPYPLSVFHIRHGVGCCSLNGVCSADNAPIVIDSAGLVRLIFRAGDPDFCEAEYLSSEQNRLWGNSALKNATVFHDKRTNEIWLRDRTDQGKRVWIFHTERGHWYTFDNVPAEDFYELNGQTAFSTSDGRLSLFDEGCDTDNDFGIRSTYVSHFFDFSSPAQWKRSLRAILCVQTVGGNITLELETEHTSKAFRMRTTSKNVPEILDRRTSLGRFRFLRFRLSIDGDWRSRIYSLSFAANP